MFGTEWICDAAYHRASSFFHRQLKATQRFHKPREWRETLLLILPGIRTCLKADIQCFAAELVLARDYDRLGNSLSHQVLIYWFV